MAGTPRRRPVRDYGPVQLANRLAEVGLARWQVERALAEGLLPGPDVAGARWSAAVVDAAAARAGEIRAAAGQVPDLGAHRAAEVLAARFGCPVEADTVAELARAGRLAVAGDYKGNPVYSGRSLEGFTDRAALDAAAGAGRLRTLAEAAAYLRVRPADLAHLVRAGRLGPARRVHGPFQARRARPKVALYRTGDLDALAADPGIDWEAVRATPPGRPSVLARLATGHRGGAR